MAASPSSCASRVAGMAGTTDWQARPSIDSWPCLLGTEGGLTQRILIT